MNQTFSSYRKSDWSKYGEGLCDWQPKGKEAIIFFTNCRIHQLLIWATEEDIISFFTVTEVNGSFSLIKSGRKMRRTRIDIIIKKRKKEKIKELKPVKSCLLYF